MDGLIRCKWAENQFKEYVDYHDREWGVPVHDDTRFFEFLILEGAQAGLSWATILKKRNGYRKAFSKFNPNAVALYDEAKIEELTKNPEIIRNKLKIKSAITNARHFLEIQKEFGSFDAYVWRFVSGKTIQNNWKSSGEVPVTTPEAEQLSADLKKRGFKFVGPTIIYSFMQACGLVNDHITDCYRHGELK